MKHNGIQNDKLKQTTIFPSFAWYGKPSLSLCSVYLIAFDSGWHAIGRTWRKFLDTYFEEMIERSSL